MEPAKTVLRVSLRLRHSKPAPFGFRPVAASCRFATVTFASDHIPLFRPSECLVCTTARVVSVDTFALGNAFSYLLTDKIRSLLLD